MAKTNQSNVFIRKGEVFFLNGALIKAHDSFGMEIMASDTFLLPSQIVSEATSKSNLQKAYYYAQQMMIEPEKKDIWQKSLDNCIASLPSNTQKKIWRACKENDMQKAICTIRVELKKEAASLN